MTNKNNFCFYFLWVLIFVSRPAYALPIPEMASAVFGIGEVFLFLVAALSIYFPFFRSNSSFSQKTRISKTVYTILFFSIGLNVYYFGGEILNNYQKAQTSLAPETRPGMRWTQAERDNDPNAITEAEAYKILLAEQANGFTDYVFIDARSRAETELGSAPGFIKIRWADLLERADELKDRTVIATCWTGMRGSEVCEKLRAKGIKCKYLKEGLSGWVKQGLPVNLSDNTTLENFGTSEPFDNSYTILSAREAVSAKRQGAHIIDVRSPQEFNKDSIPGSINIPYDELTSAVLQYKIDSLPPQKAVVACYGIFSCNEASALGWELHRMGYQYLGAYSGGVKAFNEVYDNTSIQKQNNNCYAKLKKPFVEFFSSLAQDYPLWGLMLFFSFVMGCVLYLTKQLAFLYFKNFRTRQAYKAKIAQLYPGDEVLQHREAYKFYKKNVSHVWQNVAVVVLALFYAFIFEAIYTAWSTQTLWGIHNLQDKANFSFLSFLAAGFLTWTVVRLIFKNTHNFSSNQKTIVKNKNQFIIYMIGVILFIAGICLVSEFSKIGLLYFILTLLVMSAVDAFKQAKSFYLLNQTQNHFSEGFVSLDKAYDYISHDTKATRLSYLIQQGFNVPKGFVILGDDLNKISDKSFDYMIKALGNKLAVRSSAQGEDSAQSSQAGLQLSFVPTRPEDFKKNLLYVFNSYHNLYQEEVVLAQTLINPEFSGVAFSKHPNWGGVALIEWGTGLAGNRMEGRESAEQIVVERAHADIVYQSAENEKMRHYAKEIYKLLEKVEKLYGYAVDIEWAIEHSYTHRGEIWLLQARPQTSLNHLNHNELEMEKTRVLTAQYHTLKQSEVSMVLPEPTPMSASLLQSLWTTGGAADKAARRALWDWRAGVGDIEAIFKLEQENKTIPTLALLKQKALYKDPGAYVYAFNQLLSSATPYITAPNRLQRFIAKRSYLDNKKEIESQSQTLLQTHSFHMAVDWSKLTQDNWVALWTQSLDNWQKIQEFAFYFEFMAEAFMKEAQSQLEALSFTPAQYLPYFKVGPEGFYTEDIGYRSEVDYEISQCRYKEYEAYHLPPVDKTEIADMIFGLQHTNYTTTAGFKELPIGLQNKIFFVRELLAKREEYKHHCLTLYYTLRLAIQDLQKRFHSSSYIYELEALDVKYIFSLFKPQEPDFNGMLESRYMYRQALKSQIIATQKLPDVLTAKTIALWGKNIDIELESNFFSKDFSQSYEQTENLDASLEVKAVGSFVSNPQKISGYLLMLKDNLAVGEAEKQILDYVRHHLSLGDKLIIYSKFVSPQLVQLASKHSDKIIALCAQHGSMLSHPSILAREANISFLIKTVFSKEFKNGVYLTINKSGSIFIA